MNDSKQLIKTIKTIFLYCYLIASLMILAVAALLFACTSAPL